MRKPDIIETETVGELEIEYRIWQDPCDLAWADLVDTSVCGETPPDGTEAWDVLVEAHLRVERDGQSVAFMGHDSLGGILLDRSSDSDKYMQEQIEEVKQQAYLALLDDVGQHADGEMVRRAAFEQGVALTIRAKLDPKNWPDPQGQAGK